MYKIISNFVSSVVIVAVSANICLAQQKVEVVRDQYIVQRKPSAVAASNQSLPYDIVSSGIFASVVRPRAKAGGPQKARSASQGPEIVEYDIRQAIEDCRAIIQDPTIDTCEPNFVKYNYAFPNDPGF